jgi:hypothetical protein
MKHITLLPFIRELKLRILTNGNITKLKNEDMRLTQRLQNTIAKMGCSISIPV